MDYNMGKNMDIIILPIYFSKRFYWNFANSQQNYYYYYCYLNINHIIKYNLILVREMDLCLINKYIDGGYNI
jgi:hypothetical protein